MIAPPLTPSRLDSSTKSPTPPGASAASHSSKPDCSPKHPTPKPKSRSCPSLACTARASPASSKKPPINSARFRKRKGCGAHSRRNRELARAALRFARVLRRSSPQGAPPSQRSGRNPHTPSTQRTSLRPLGLCQGSWLRFFKRKNRVPRTTSHSSEPCLLRNALQRPSARGCILISIWRPG
jgi:hypothetical protein